MKQVEEKENKLSLIEQKLFDDAAEKFRNELDEAAEPLRKFLFQQELLADSFDDCQQWRNTLTERLRYFLNKVTKHFVFGFEWKEIDAKQDFGNSPILKKAVSDFFKNLEK